MENPPFLYVVPSSYPVRLSLPGDRRGDGVAAGGPMASWHGMAWQARHCRATRVPQRQAGREVWDSGNREGKREGFKRFKLTESAVCSLHQHQLRTNRTGESDRSPPATATHGPSERATGRSADRTDNTRGAAAAMRQAQACKGKPGTTSSRACPSYLLLRREVPWYTRR